MNISPAQWDGLADLYLEATSGSFLPGIVHNLNNFGHVMDLQLELLQTKLPQIQSGRFGDLDTRFQRIATASKDLLMVMETVGNRFFFTQKERVHINIEQYFDWLMSFWKNNLFFKHKIDLHFLLDQNCPNLNAVPFVLTLCIEEGLKNGIEACQEYSTENATLDIVVRPDKDAVRIGLTTPGSLKLDDDPFAPGTTTKPGRLGLGLSIAAHFAKKVHWDVTLDSHGSETVYTLRIPDCNTVVPTL
ncbi:MAG: hypothetical protein ACLFTB_01805 [Desulfovibrionales bacterium]